MRNRWIVGLVAVAVSSVFVGSSALASTAKTSSSQITKGGTVAITMPAITWPTLDPATSGVSELNGSILSAIFGQLIEAGPKSALVPDMATSWDFSKKGLQFDMTIRPGQKFQDGTPFDAAAVAYSMNRDLLPANACECLADFADVTSVTAPSKYDVRLKLSTPDSVLPADFIDDPMNWTMSPTALQTKGIVAFDQDPIGAGPFEVVSNQTNSTLTLQRYPSYWEKGHPYLSGLKFIATTSDQSDFSAVQSGSAQMTSVTNVQIWQQAKTTPGLTAYEQAAVNLSFIRFNTTTAPFNNPIAREAVAYATNRNAILSALYSNVFPAIQGFTSPYLLFYQKKVSNYPAYNLAKAQQLVSSIPGGIAPFTLIAGVATTSVEESDALAAQWTAAGMTVKIVNQLTPATTADLATNNWQVMDAGWSGCDIDPGDCAPINFSSIGYWSGIKSGSLDGLINKAAEFQNPTTRGKYYDQISQYLNANYDIVWLWAKPTLVIASTTVQGLPKSVGLDGPFNWESVWVK